jgi:hypothetical protein
MQQPQQQARQYPYHQSGQKTAESQSQLPSGALFDRKVDLITAGLQPRYNTYLKDESQGQISRGNALVMCDYILAMNTEINPSNEYRKTTIQVLIQLSKFLSKFLSKSEQQQQKKPFDEIIREDVLAFLDGLRKPELLLTGLAFSP